MRLMQIWLECAIGYALGLAIGWLVIQFLGRFWIRRERRALGRELKSRIWYSSDGRMHITPRLERHK